MTLKELIDDLGFDLNVFTDDYETNKLQSKQRNYEITFQTDVNPNFEYSIDEVEIKDNKKKITLKANLKGK